MQQALQSAHTESSLTADPTVPILYPVPPEAIDGYWPLVAPHLARAVERSKETTTTDLFWMCKNDEASLWVVEEQGSVASAFVAECLTFPTEHKVMRITYGGGDGLMDAMKILMPEFEAAAKSLGCDMVEIHGRRGWRRVFPDFRESAIVLSKEV